MRGDYSRLTFDSRKHYSSVRMQQGRLQLDSDWNEAQDIRLHHERMIARDVIGTAGGPKDNAGFLLSYDREEKDLRIGRGRYYVDGILCENDYETLYSLQPHNPGKPKDLPGGRYVAYLDVWEGAVTAVEDPDIREVALDGPDTAARHRVMWKLKIEPAFGVEKVKGEETRELQSRMAAKIERGRVSGDDGGLCSTSISDRYGFLGNNLYRVEIHEGGRQANATFKWSRDNAGIIRAVQKIEGKIITILDPARNCAQIFRPGQYVEVTNDQIEFKGETGEFARIEAIEGTRITVNREIPPERLKELMQDNLKVNTKVLLWDGEPRPACRREGWAGIRIKDGKTVQLLPESGYASGAAVGPDSFALSSAFVPGMRVELSSDSLAEQGRALYGTVESTTTSAEGESLNLIDIKDHARGEIKDETEAREHSGEGPAVGSYSALNDQNFPEGSRPRIRKWDSENEWIELEMDIKVSFPKEDEYRKGDYWLVPSREIRGNIIWPRDQDNKPIFLPRQGVVHHLAKIAELERGEDGWSISDQRNLFPELAGGLALDYAGGDGQQGWPGEVLPSPFLAAVSSSGLAAAGRGVVFKIVKGEGRLTAPLISPISPISQTSPSGAEGGGERSGKGSGKGSGEGAGEGAGEVVALTDERGIAACYCRMDSAEIVVAAALAVPKAETEAEADLESSSISTQGAPQLRFRACCPSAEGVGYRLPQVHHQQGRSITVKEALDSLYLAPHGSQCAASIGEGGTYAGLDEAIMRLVEQKRNDISLCLLPGRHSLEKSIYLKRAGGQSPEMRSPDEIKKDLVQTIEVPLDTHLSIKGSGRGSKIVLDEGKRIILEGLESLCLENLEIEGEGQEEGLLTIRSIDSLSLKGCHIRAKGDKASGEGTALSIKNGEGVLNLDSNQIEGLLCLYEGDGRGEFKLKPGEAGNLEKRACLLLGKVRRGTLNLCNNQIGRIAVGDKMALLIKKQLAEKQGGKPVDGKDPAYGGAKMEDIFHVIILSNNVINGGPNLLLSGNLILSGNFFERQTASLLADGSPEMNWAISCKSVFTGNIGEETKITCASDAMDKSANLLEIREL